MNLLDLWQIRTGLELTPEDHLGLLVAIQQLGAEGCREELLNLCMTGPKALPSPRSAQSLAAVLEKATAENWVPQSDLSPLEYSQLCCVMALNGMRRKRPWSTS